MKDKIYTAVLVIIALLPIYASPAHDKRTSALELAELKQVVARDTGPTSETDKYTDGLAIVATASSIMPAQITSDLEGSIFDIPLDVELQKYIIDLCTGNDIDPRIMLALIERESSFQADAIGDGGNSYGLCQIQPRWHSERMERLGVTDLLDPKQNVAVAVDYLRDLLNTYDGDIAKALVSYNQGSYKGAITQYAEWIIKRSEEL